MTDENATLSGESQGAAPVDTADTTITEEQQVEGKPLEQADDGYLPVEAPPPTPDDAPSFNASLDGAIRAVIQYRDSLPPGKPLEVGDIDAMRTRMASAMGWEL